MNDRRVFENFWKMNIEPRLERFDQIRKEKREVWKSTNIFMRWKDRLMLFIVENNRLPEICEVASMQVAHRIMLNNYDNIEYFTGGDKCQE